MILVTGATGFLGAYIAKHLVQQGHPVRALRRSAAVPFFIEPTVWERVEWVEGDVLDVVSLQEAMQGVAAVVHAAAVVSFHRRERQRMYAVNVDGTANVVNAALESGVKRLLHVSSVAALGRQAVRSTVDESKQWEEGPNNTHYAVSKHRAELQAWRGFAEGLQGVIVNPSTILGFGNWHQSSCAIFRNGYRAFPWYTEGVNGFVGVDDTAHAVVRLLLSDINERRFIINAENRSFQWLLTTIAEGFGKQPPHRRATPLLGALTWRAEAVKAFFTGQKPLLSKETAKVAQSKTSFSNEALLKALPGFAFAPLETVIAEACAKYKTAVAEGQLRL